MRKVCTKKITEDDFDICNLLSNKPFYFKIEKKFQLNNHETAKRGTSVTWHNKVFWSFRDYLAEISSQF